ncbi:hypothetical protein [Laceyella putida]|uniref:Uncharacterized protein n=1 Tax=Laceyella putida TaxID=110101 RepID=A0ABW2RQV9_9BACL
MTKNWTYDPAVMEKVIDWLQNERVPYLDKEIKHYEKLYETDQAFASFQLAVLHAKRDEANMLLDKLDEMVCGEDKAEEK